MDGLPLVGEEVGVGVGNQLLQQLSQQQAPQRGWQRQDGRQALLHGRGPADGLGGDAHRQAERQLLAAWGQPSQQRSRIAGRRFAWGCLGRARHKDQGGQGLLLGAGVGADGAWGGVEQVGVVGHAGALAHVVAEQVQVPGAFEVISRWLVAGPMDIDNRRRGWRAHGASLGG